MSITGTVTNIETSIEERAEELWDNVPETVRNPSHKFALCSVVAPNGTSQKSENMALRIYGCASTLEEANAWAKKIRESNDFFDIFTIETCAWAPFPPDVSKIGDVRYSEQLIQDVMSDYVSQIRGEKKLLADRLEREQKDKERKVLEAESGKKET